VKQNWATARLEGATSKMVWDFVKWYKHSRKRCHPLYSSPSSIPAPSDQDWARIFANQFFPDPPSVLPFIPTDELDPQRPFHPLTRPELEKAILSPCKDMAPGPSNINYTMVRWAWNVAPDLLFHLYASCMEVGHYPVPFKHSVTTVVPKPNKNDYTSPSAYRPIQPIECLGKILDKILARQVQYEVAKRAHSVTWGCGPSQAWHERVLLVSTLLT
jgi:hypothetical protein